MKLFSRPAGGCLGVDIGAAGIKIVEISQEGGKFKLLSYGFSENKSVGDKIDWKNDAAKTAAAIKKILKDSDMKSRQAYAALPGFSVFSSILNLSNVTAEALPATIQAEAKKIVPVPLEEMVVDWEKVEEDKNKKTSKVIFTAAPKLLVKKYMEIFKQAGINLISLETETYSLARSLFLPGDNALSLVADIGLSTSDVFIVQKGFPVMNRSLKLGGGDITNAIAKNLSISLDEAEQIKYDLSVNRATDGQLTPAIETIIKPLFNEIQYILSQFKNKTGQEVERVILTGGSAPLFGLAEYLEQKLDKKVVVADSWARIDYAPDLKDILSEIGPRLSVAVGLALRKYGD